MPIPFSSWWRLDETTGQPRTDQIGGMTLADNGGVTQVAGHVETFAAGFNASLANQFLNHADDAILTASTSGTGDWSMLAWTWLNSKPGVITAIHKGGIPSFTHSYSIDYGDSGDLFSAEVRQGENSLNVLASGFGSAPLSTWLMVAVRFRTTTGLEISINGGAWDQSLGDGGYITPSSNQFCIGASNGSDRFWDGRIGPVGLGSFWMTDAQRDALWNGGVGSDPTPISGMQEYVALHAADSTLHLTAEL